MFAGVGSCGSRHLLGHDEQDFVPVVAAGLHRSTTPTGRTNDQDSGGDGSTFAGHRSGHTGAFPDGGVFPDSHQADAKIIFRPKGLLYRTIQQVVRQILYPGNSRSWVALRSLAAKEGTDAGDHARLQRDRYQAVAVIIVLYESRAKARAHIRFRSVVAGANPRRTEPVRRSARFQIELGRSAGSSSVSNRLGLVRRQFDQMVRTKSAKWLWSPQLAGS